MKRLLAITIFILVVIGFISGCSNGASSEDRSVPLLGPWAGGPALEQLDSTQPHTSTVATNPLRSTPPQSDPIPSYEQYVGNYYCTALYEEDYFLDLRNDGVVVEHTGPYEGSNKYSGKYEVNGSRLQIKWDNLVPSHQEGVIQGNAITFDDGKKYVKK